MLLCGCDLSFLKTVYGLEVNLFIYFFRGEFSNLVMLFFLNMFGVWGFFFFFCSLPLACCKSLPSWILVVPESHGGRGFSLVIMCFRSGVDWGSLASSFVISAACCAQERGDK